MAYKPNNQTINQGDGSALYPNRANIYVTVDFKSDSGKPDFTETIPVGGDTTDVGIAQYLARYVAGMNKAEATAPTLTNGAVADPGTPVEDPAFAVRSKVATLKEQLDNLNVLQAAATAGLISADDADLQAVQASAPLAPAIKATVDATPAIVAPAA